MTRARGKVTAFFLVLAAGLAPAATMAQGKYPTKPIRVIVPFSTGSATDLTARLLSEKLSASLRQPVIVENRPSAGGIVAASAVAGAEPDGHTLLFHGAAFAITASLYGKLPYDTLKDFAPVSQVSSTCFVIVVSPSLKIRSARELIALAKLKPGQVNFASAGIGSSTHMSAEAFKSAAAIEAVHVPYKGTPEALTDTMTGRVQFFIAPLVPALPLIRDGRVLALAVTTASRSPALPDVPTVAENGVARFDFDGWLGLWAPAKTNRIIVNELSAVVARILDAPDMKERLLAQGQIARPSTPEQLAALMGAEIEKMRVLAKISGARAD